MSKIASVRRLLNKSLSSKPHSKSQTFPNENDSPLHPNIQLSEPQFPPPNPKKSISNPPMPQKAIEFPNNETYMNHNLSVKVVVRIRPKTVNPKLGDPTVKKVSDDLVAVGDREFGFDSILDPNSNQEDVFKLIGIPVVKDALSGYNVSVLSYGQTESGKTYTMWGPPSSMSEGQCASDDRGIVSRIFQMLFSHIEREKENSNDTQVTYRCRCSFLEIHHGQIGDLLDLRQTNLQIKDDAKNGFYIESLTEKCVQSYDDVTQIITQGLSNRKVGASSSRSHSVFTCVIESWCKENLSNSISNSKTSRITLVDLADGEQEFERECEDARSSLSHLGHLVNVLAEGAQVDDLTYKDSRLTHLLQQSLGGNAKLSVICTISSDIKNYGETLSTLRFGQRVRSIRNKPVVNETTEEDMDGLTDQIRQLKEELIRAKLKTTPSGRNVRESVNQLTMSINRSLMLPRFDEDDDIEEEINVDENDVLKLREQLDKFSSEQGSCDSYLYSDHETNSDEVTSSQAAQSESPKFRNLYRKNIVTSSNLSQGSLRSSKIFSGPTESLAASLQRGLEIIDSHQNNSSSSLNKSSSVAFSFEHLMLKPSPKADIVNGQDGSSLPSSIMGVKEQDKDLVIVCYEQEAKITELNRLVEQLKYKGENPETWEADENDDMRGKEELLMEIQSLKRKLQSYTEEKSPPSNKSIENLRTSLLSKSMHLRKSMNLSNFNNAEELEKEREKWTEMESEWINLTDELRLDIESHRRKSERVEIELENERKNKEELDDALERAVLGHVRFIEQFTELQEKYNQLNESHRRVMETVNDVKKAAAKAGGKGGNGSRYVKAFAAELSSVRVEEKRDRERLRRENKGLRIQLRETAEAVQTAGELLVRLREAEEAASITERSVSDVQEENEKLKKKVEKMKEKHKTEMVAMKQYMVESKLPESALRPMHYEESIGEEQEETRTSYDVGNEDGDEGWRSAFGATYNQFHY